MLSDEENALFTRVGPGTPVGNLLRRYWHAVGCSELVTPKPQRVKVLGEELVLYRAGDGAPVLMELRCAHRRVALDYGRVEGDCIRCPYHGWLYDRTGQCVEQPAEPEGSTFKDKVKLAGYRTEEFGGLVFGYLGPEPAPLLPLFDLLFKTEGVKEILQQPVYTSWFNHVENVVDISHLAWLHGYTFPAYGARKLSYHWDRKSYGVDNVMRVEGIEDPHVSCYGFPTINRFALPPVEPGGPIVSAMIFRVPMDDVSIRQYFVRFYPSDKPTFRARTREPKFGEYAPLANDWWGIDVFDQDRMAIEQQGVIADRTKERLSATDGGIILLRQMIRESLAAIEAGQDPPCVIRDPQQQVVNFPQKSDAIAARTDDADYSMAGGATRTR